MAKTEFPIKIDGFKCVEDIAQTVLNYTYKGKTLKEWVDSISEPQTNADRIRTMTDEELAEFLTTVAQNSANKLCESLKTVDVDLSNCDFGILYKTHLDWLKQEVKER